MIFFRVHIAFVLCLSIVFLLGCSEDTNQEQVIKPNADTESITFISVTGEIDLSADVSRAIRQAIAEAEVEILNRPPNDGIPMATIKVDGETYAIGTPNPPGLYDRSYQGGKPALIKHPMFADLGQYAGLLSDEYADKDEIEVHQKKIATWFD